MRRRTNNFVYAKKEEGQQIFILVQITIGFCIPLLIIVTSYWGLTATIQKHQSEVKTQSHWKTHEQQVTRRVIIFVSACESRFRP